MKKPSSRGSRSVMIIKSLVLLLTIHLTTAPVVLGNDWSGVDKSVIERYATKAGRSAWAPFINTDQGDLLLFVFLLAGIVGGFIIGYYWRVLFKDTSWTGRERDSHKED
jgi:ABC-type cobalt transport system substrate-binding protein